MARLLSLTALIFARSNFKIRRIFVITESKQCNLSDDMSRLGRPETTRNLRWIDRENVMVTQ